MARLHEFETKYLSSDPEVFVDFLSIKSLKQRYVEKNSTENGTAFCQWNRKVDDDFETFVKEFPIDDNISECFASSSDDTIKNMDGIMSEGDAERVRKAKHKAEKESKSKVTEAVCHIEKKLSQNRKQKTGTNFFRRKEKRRPVPKKSLSYDDLRRTDSEVPFLQEQTNIIGRSSSRRRCRVLTETADNRRNLTRKYVSANNSGISNSSSSSSSGSNGGGKFRRDGTPPKANEVRHDHIDLRLIKTRHVGKETVAANAQRTNQQSGLVSHKVLRKALRESMKTKTTSDQTNAFGNVCKACRELKMSDTGNSLAHCAAYKGHLFCLQALVQNASNITSSNQNGMRPSQVALSAGHMDCWNYLTVSELSHVLLREMCSYGSLVETVTSQLESVRSQAEKLRQSLEVKSQDLKKQIRSLKDLTTAMGRNLVAYPSNKQKCLGHQGSTYQDIQDSLTLLERVDRKLDELCRFDCTVGGNGSIVCLELTLQKIEDLLLDDNHMNDIRQLENVEKRNRVIRNFLLEDVQQFNVAVRHSYAESTSTDSLRASFGGSHTKASRTSVDPGCPPIAVSTVRGRRTQRSETGSQQEQPQHSNPHLQHQSSNLQNKPQPNFHAHPNQRQRARSSSSRRSENRGAAAAAAVATSAASAAAAVAAVVASAASAAATRVSPRSMVTSSLSASDSESSSEWDTTSQGSIASLNATSEGSETHVRPPPLSCDWSFLRSASSEQNLHKAQKSQSLSQSSLEVLIGCANRASSQGSLRQHRLANHFRYMQKDAKQKNGLVERVIKGSQGEEKQPQQQQQQQQQQHQQQEHQYQQQEHQHHHPPLHQQQVNDISCHGARSRTEAGPFTTTTTTTTNNNNNNTTTSPSSSSKSMASSRSRIDVKGSKHKGNPLECFKSSNSVREDLIGRCRQLPGSPLIHLLERPDSAGAISLEESNIEKPWYDVSDDETSVYTWPHDVAGYDSESSYYN